MGNVFEVIDPRGRKVICTEECWFGHILGARSWMAGMEEAVSAAIEKPSFGICCDPHNENRHIYYRLYKNKPRYIKVVVDFVREDLGRVVTAFPTDSGKSGEKLIWPESTD